MGASYIETITGETVHSVGIGSATMAGVLSNGWDSYNADIYIISAGINDASLGTGATSFTNAVKGFVTAIKAINPNAEIYFVTPPAIHQPNQYDDFKFPIEFYRIGLWELAPFNGFHVINSLKWNDIVYSSDKVHPALESADQIGKYIVSALLTYGDSASHTVEYSKLGRSDGTIYLEANNGVLSINVVNLRATATSIASYTATISPNGLDTLFTTSETAFINPSTGGAGYAKYDPSNPNSLEFYCNGVASGGAMYTGMVRLPVRVLSWECPYL